MTTVSSLPETFSLDGSEYSYVVKDGASKKVTIANLLSGIATSPSALETIQDTIFNNFTSSSDVSLTYNDAGNTSSIGLTNTGVTAGTYGGPTSIPQITVSATGRITNASANSIVLGALAALSTLDLSSAYATGTLAAARFPALTGDVTTSAGNLATTITTGAVTLAKMANLAANSFIGNNTGSAATPIALTVAQAQSLLGLGTAAYTATGTSGHVVPYLDGANTWSANNTFAAVGLNGVTPKAATTLTMSGNASNVGSWSLFTNLYYNAGYKYVANGFGQAIQFDASGNILFLVAPNNAGGADAAATLTTAATITPNGTLLTSALDLSNAAAGQIVFPATQNASAGANTLDDYEEGTWTPAFSASTTNPTVTYTAQTGAYTKIGNHVTAWGRLNIATVSGGSGYVTISGLPFACNNSEHGRSALSIGYSSTWSVSPQTGMFLAPNTTSIALFTNGTVGNSQSALNTTVDVSLLVAGCQLYFSISYMV